ncbi:MAG: TrkH family potassium uptake protein [Candidatus Alcyoniella australis]|nr:TrkH family potassium uptake protein [Candidatus Alcyoniella australis]
MHIRVVLRTLGAFAVILGCCMLAPMVVGLIYGELDSALSFALSAGIAVVLGAVLILPLRSAPKEIAQRDGIALVAFAWVLACLLGALPFYLSGAMTSWTDAVFECASGFTTTGASILTDVETVDHAILFWRALTHWLGGMGIIVLSITILPLLGIGGMQLYRAEVPGPSADKLTPRIAQTAKALWGVYALLTVLEAGLLMLGGMNLFEAICHAFATMATGGFSTRNGSIGDYGPFIQYVVSVFMVLAGINFALHYLMLKGKFRRVLRDTELRVYLAIFALAVIFIWAGLWLTTTISVAQSFRLAVFQVPTILSTTGFSTADFGTWPSFLQVFLLFLMFVGGSAGSTAGGMKVARFILLTKHAYQELFQLLHPRAVNPVKFGRRAVPRETMRGVWNFFFLYVALFVVSTVLLGIMLEPHLQGETSAAMTTISAAVASIGNIGPGLGLVGPGQNYAWMPSAAKWLLIALMLLGRLEIYTILILLVPATWRRYV